VTGRCSFTLWGVARAVASRIGLVTYRFVQHFVGRKEKLMNRGVIGTIIGVLVVIILVIVILQLT
jgi:tetrahydromethanopterin S-methyltransferase subunit F